MGLAQCMLNATHPRWTCGCSDLDKRVVEQLAGSPAFGGFNLKAGLEELVSLLTEAVRYLWSRAVAHSQHDPHVVVKLSPWNLEREGEEGKGGGKGVRIKTTSLQQMCFLHTANLVDQCGSCSHSLCR